MDCVREEVYDAIKHIDYNKWLNVSLLETKMGHLKSEGEILRFYRL